MFLPKTSAHLPENVLGITGQVCGRCLDEDRSAVSARAVVCWLMLLSLLASNRLFITEVDSANVSEKSMKIKFVHCFTLYLTDALERLQREIRNRRARKLHGSEIKRN
ncbi:hypothetical protein C0Q70_16942 [Pomacea canaliculata]|uniref:Uncharacterized protein n=1 Tax=Pomacea canaliculata TaxID=400727 RepID=A0A2T7NR72_POMCA|nr:hypothetical protein C0Q70_16942 [Pomacea canaliculata]